MYGAVVAGKGSHPYAQILRDYKHQLGIQENCGFKPENLKEIKAIKANDSATHDHIINNNDSYTLLAKT